MPWISLPSFGKSSNVARTMAASADFETDEGADGVDVRFTGRLTLARLGDLPARLDALVPIRALDLSDIERIDTVGAWIVKIGRAHVCTPVTNAHPVCRLLLEKKNDHNRTVELPIISMQLYEI